MSIAPMAASVSAGAGTSARSEPYWHRVARNAFPFIVVALLWELLAHFHLFPRRLFPPVEDVFAAFVRLTAARILPHHVLETLLRLGVGFSSAAVVGVLL